MKTREELVSTLDACKKAAMDAEQALADFDAAPEQNMFSDLEKACWAVEDKLESRAFKDCQGAHNCGADKYEQEFIVGDTHYIGTLKVEYNRHDKTYYYIEESEFSYAEKQP